MLRMTYLAASYSKGKHKKLPELAWKVSCRPELVLLILTTAQLIYRVVSRTCRAPIPNSLIPLCMLVVHHDGYTDVLPHVCGAARWGFSTAQAGRRNVFSPVLKGDRSRAGWL